MSQPQSNQALADHAHGIAVKAQGGTLTRRAWGCVSVALGTTGTIPAARLALAVVRPPEVRDAALAVLDKLTSPANTGPEEDDRGSSNVA